MSLPGTDYRNGETFPLSEGLTDFAITRSIETPRPAGQRWGVSVFSSAVIRT